MKESTESRRYYGQKRLKPAKISTTFGRRHRHWVAQRFSIGANLTLAERRGASTWCWSGREATGGKGRYHRNRSSHLGSRVRQFSLQLMHADPRSTEQLYGVKPTRYYSRRHYCNLRWLLLKVKATRKNWPATF